MNLLLPTLESIDLQILNGQCKSMKFAYGQKKKKVSVLTLYAPEGGVQSARISFFLRLLFSFSRKHAIKLFFNLRCGPVEKNQSALSFLV